MFELVQVTVLFVALFGVIVAVKVSLFPSTNDRVVLFKFIPVTAISVVITVTIHVAVFPFDVFAVIVAVPGLTPVILPFDTVAIFVLELVHVIVLSSVVFVGVIDAVIVLKSPFLILKLV